MGKAMPATGVVEYGSSNAKAATSSSLFAQAQQRFQAQQDAMQQVIATGAKLAPSSAQPQGQGLTGQFNALLAERSGLQSEKMGVQKSQLQKTKTQKNNTAFQNAFSSRSNMIDLMRQLLDASRQTTAAQQRVFM